MTMVMVMMVAIMVGDEFCDGDDDHDDGVNVFGYGNDYGDGDDSYDDVGVWL